MQVTARKTQQELEYQLSELICLLMDGVFGDDAYDVGISFEMRRNRTEVDLSFIRDGYKLKPLKSGGLGAADVASAALRYTLWASAMPKSRNVIIQDEPFKHLKGEVANERILKVIKEISDKLKLQIIMVSDERVPREMIIENADKVFEVGIRKGRSYINTIK